MHLSTWRYPIIILVLPWHSTTTMKNLPGHLSAYSEKLMPLLALAIAVLF